MLEARSAVSVTGTATLAAGAGTLVGAILTGGIDAATAVIRTGGATGPTICTLKVAPNATVTFTPAFSVGFFNLHVTLTGTAPAFTAYI